MKVLVACEESQRVTVEFRKLGHEAYSCDLLDCSGNHPEWHIKKDVTLLLNGNCIFHTVDGVEHEISGKWDMIIAFLPCTYLTVTGNRWFSYEKYGNKAIQRMYEKRTCLWLKGLQKLTPTEIVNVPDRVQFKSGKTMAKWYVEAANLPKEQRALVRSKTFPGIAKAMAMQWGSVKQELNERFGKEQYFDTDSLQPNKTIIAKIENINHCPNQNTCCIVSPFVHCNYNYKSDSCIKAHKNFIHQCEQVHKQMKAKNNSEWHHVRLAKLANIDIDMLDEKRQRYLKIYKELIKTVNDLHKCKTAATYENRWLRFKQVIADDIYFRGTTLYMTRFLDSKISMCNVECGLWTSADEKATSFIKSRRYRNITLK